jgi:hypothetical protein
MIYEWLVGEIEVFDQRARLMEPRSQKLNSFRKD